MSHFKDHFFCFCQKEKGGLFFLTKTSPIHRCKRQPGYWNFKHNHRIGTNNVTEELDGKGKGIGSRICWAEVHTVKYQRHDEKQACFSVYSELFLSSYLPTIFP